ncbi:S-adenosyl-L-methionine-dependent methyltransferase [Trametes meyenii]|nr:S-adenosyl-L-methionine-dependent methyltransferase [Trametes meyenii]
MSESAQAPAAAHTHAHEHAHGHAHEHAHGHGHAEFVEANKTYFDEHADKIEQEHPQARQFGLMVVNRMRELYPAVFDKERTEVLDYACGIGLVSQALRPHVKSVVGVDISQGSVDVYNKQAAELGAASQIRAVCAELKGEPGELDGAKFDLITCSAAYHHIVAIDQTTRALAALLKPHGVLLVADLKAAPDGAEIIPSTHHHMVPHAHGLSEETVRGVFEGAGLGAFELTDASMPNFMNPEGPELVWFVARGVKPGEGEKA